MRERPILFSAPMVRAILSGTKVQTRRAVDRLSGFGRVKEFGRSDTAGYDWAFRDPKMRWNEIDDTRLRQQFCPYGVAGDRLWVRECFAAWWVTATGKRSHVMGYRADIDDPQWDGLGAEDPWWLGAKWEPSIHMPRAFSRITLEVTGVRVQRLHEITSADILAEGIRVPVAAESGNVLVDVSTTNGPGAFLTRDQYGNADALLRAHWAALWCQVNGRASWDANPWIWAISFCRVEGEPRHA